MPRGTLHTLRRVLVRKTRDPSGISSDVVSQPQQSDAASSGQKVHVCCPQDITFLRDDCNPGIALVKGAIHVRDFKPPLGGNMPRLLHGSRSSKERCQSCSGFGRMKEKQTSCIQ